MQRFLATIALVCALGLACSQEDTGSSAETNGDGADTADDPMGSGAQSSAKHYYVSPSGSDANDGLSPATPFATIAHAIELAVGGNTIELGEGDYFEDVVSQRAGITGAPIALVGPAGAVVKGAGGLHVVELNHSYWTLSGFTIDGLFGDTASAAGYRDKLLYVIGKEAGQGVTGLKIESMTLQNAGGECLRLRYFATANEIAYNTIANCGMYDFVFNQGGKNGEGIYVGTAPEQTGDGKNPTRDPDASNANWIHHNAIDTEGNECVDIKEAALDNIFEYNRCTGQKDPKSGGLDSRGKRTVFRYNEVYGNLGAGVRLGGDGDDDGIDNDVYGNTIRDNAAGGIKVQRSPQGKICGNTMSGNAGGNAVGSFGSDYDPTVACPTEL